MRAHLGSRPGKVHAANGREASRVPARARVCTRASKDAPEQQPAAAGSSLSSIDVDPDLLLRASPSSAARSFASPDWLDSAPRVRVRAADSRQMEELVELAVLNERLSGTLQPWEARRKLEYLRTKRKNWEKIFTYITSQDLDATLAAIEDANRKVEESLNEGARDQTSVVALRSQLQALQADVSTAQERLAATQARVAEELERVNNLRLEAEALERLRLSESASASPLASSAPSTTRTLEPASTSTSTSLSIGSSASTLIRDARTATAAPQQQQRRVPAGSKPAGRSNKQLKSSLELEEPLKQFWYAAEFSSRLTKDTLVPFEIFGQPWVLFRDAEGKAGCIKDECAHRACPLSIGKIENGEVVCPYHGWAYDKSGSCTKMPSTRHCKGVGVKALKCVEKDGFVWVWPGAQNVCDEDLPEIPNTMPPEGFDIHAEIMVDVPVEHGLLVENLLDLAHAPFTHTSTFARGWPVPDAVKFHATKLLSGHWDPYPIEMSFLPPCMTVSMIGLDKPGQVARGARADACKNHLHQLHVCLPSKPGHTRLLYRMSMDFIPWLRSVPFIDRVWKSVAAQVLGEDLVLVLGQQDRMQRGGDTWNFPVSYDKIAVRYRRWRNEVARAGVEGGRAASERAQQLAAGASMNAGQLFSLDEDDVLNEIRGEALMSTMDSMDECSVDAGDRRTASPERN